MDKQTLNRKLAEWAGFTVGDKYGWNYPDDTWGRFLPHFDESLDACFEWLVPKLREEGLMITISLLGSVSGQWKVRLHRGYFPNETICEVEAELLTPTFCLAIEKLIDRGGKC